ncbi:MAG: hypothetical protein ACFFCS_12395 [Candidatus Hodarchaeota archaeon]
MSYIPKYILKRMLPASGVNLKGDKIEITYANLINPLNIEGIHPVQMEILINGTEVDPDEVEMSTPPGDTLNAGGEIKFLFPNTFGVNKGDTMKISFHWFGQNIKLEQDRVLN